MKQQNKEAKKTVSATVQTSSFTGRNIFLLIGAIVAITLISFSPAMHNSFTNWDDNIYVFDNPYLVKPLPDAITYFMQMHYFVGNYIPLTMIVYALGYTAAGIDPSFFHAVNIVFHLLNVVLVFWFIYLLSGRRSLVAAFVALFFGIHPMHVESVVWVAELKDVLYSFFFLMGLVTYLKYTDPARSASEQRKTLPLWGLTFVLFVLSCLSKPAAVVFPLVLLSLDFYTGRKFSRSALMEKVPFFIISLIFGVIAIRSQQADRLLHDYYPFIQRFFFATQSLLTYIAKLFVPAGLSILYPYPPMIDGHLPYTYYAAPVVVAAIFYGVYRTLKYSRVIAFGFLFFLINIILVLQLLSVGDATMADRYTYISYIGLLFIVAMGFDHVYRSADQKVGQYKSIIMGLVIVLAIASSYATYARCKDWENEDVVANDLLSKYPDDRIALNNKGFTLFAQGKHMESLPYFKKAIEVKPDYIMAYINLSNSYLGLRDLDNAEKYIDLALTKAPDNFDLLTTKGYFLFLKERYAEAITFCRKAINIKKDHAAAYMWLSNSYYKMQDLTGWENLLNEGLKNLPEDPVLLNDKGYSLFLKGKYDDAVIHYKAALKYKPDYPTASANLAKCYQVIDSVQRSMAAPQ